MKMQKSQKRHLPESSDVTLAIHFMEAWIPKALTMTTKAGKIKLESVHRVSGLCEEGGES